MAQLAQNSIYSRTIRFNIKLINRVFILSKLSYIGHTFNRLGTSMGTTSIRHKDIERKTRFQERRNSFSQTFSDFERVSILMVEPNNFKRKVLESLNILLLDITFLCKFS